MARIRVTRANAVFLAVWRRLSRGEHVPAINIGDENQATSVRMKFYQVIRPYRTLTPDHPDFDAELQDAADRFAIRANGKFLEFGPKVGEAHADMLTAALGIREDEVMSPDEQEMQARLSGLITKEDSDNG